MAVGPAFFLTPAPWTLLDNNARLLVLRSAPSLRLLLMVTSTVAGGLGGRENENPIRVLLLLVLVAKVLKETSSYKLVT